MACSAGVFVEQCHKENARQQLATKENPAWCHEGLAQGTPWSPIYHAKPYGARTKRPHPDPTPGDQNVDERTFVAVLESVTTEKAAGKTLSGKCCCRPVPRFEFDASTYRTLKIFTSILKTIKIYIYVYKNV